MNVASCLAAGESAVLRDEARQVEQLLLGEGAPEELLLRVHLQQRLVAHLLSLNLKGQCMDFSLIRRKCLPLKQFLVKFSSFLKTIKLFSSAVCVHSDIPLRT